MDYVNLGSTGLKVSRLCLGAMTYGSKRWREWALEEQESRPFIRRALELGINFFDTADMYSDGASEEILGRALRDLGPSRDKVVIGTKGFNPMGDDPNQRGLSRKHIRHAIDESLKRLGTDYIDLYQIHRFDYDTPIEETLEALDEVVRAGSSLSWRVIDVRLAVREEAVLSGLGFRRGRKRERDCAEARYSERAGGAGVDLAAAGHYVADRRGK